MRIPAALLLMLGTMGEGLPSAIGAETDRPTAMATEPLPQTLEEVDRTIAALPPNARMHAWEFAPSRGRFSQVLIGSRYGYLRDTGAYGSNPDAIFATTRPAGHVNYDDHNVYDVRHHVVCFDLQTGKRLWTRAFSGPLAYVLDPRTDALMVLGERLYCFNASDGKVLVERKLSPEVRNIRQVRFGRHLVASSPHGARRAGVGDVRGPVPTYDADTGVTTQETYRRLERLSPNGLRMVTLDVAQSPGDVTTTVRCVPPGGGAADWTYSVPGYSANHPCWIGDDVLVLSGSAYSLAAVHCLDGRTGKPRWVTPLSHGAYTVEHHWDDGLFCDWEPIGIVAGYVAAITADGVVWFLDRETGEVRHQIASMQVHAAMPQVVGNTLVMAGRERVYAAPLDVVFGQLRQSEAALLQHKADLLLRLGGVVDAEKVSRRLLRFAPERASVWRQRARIADKLGQEFDAVAAECRAMQIAGDYESPWLRERYALLKRIPTGPIRADIHHLGLFVYAGTQDGLLLRIHASTLNVVETEQCPTSVSALSIRDGVLGRVGEDRHWVEVAHVAGVLPQAANPGAEPKGMPRQWYAFPAREGAILHHQGRYYRPLAGGRVVETDGKAVVEHASPFPEIETWSFLLAPAGPLGYGTGGVYTLDENLCPKERLIDVGIDPTNRFRHRVACIASDGKTLAFVTGGAQTSALQIWSADGKQKIREETVRFSEDRAPLRLRAVEGGYLFAGEELAWVPAEPERPLWRFRLPRLMQDHDVRQRFAAFGIPILVDGRLWCAEGSGGIYVFDLHAITGSQKRKPRP